MLSSKKLHKCHVCTPFRSRHDSLKFIYIQSIKPHLKITPRSIHCQLARLCVDQSQKGFPHIHILQFIIFLHLPMTETVSSKEFIANLLVFLSSSLQSLVNTFTFSRQENFITLFLIDNPKLNLLVIKFWHKEN